MERSNLSMLILLFVLSISLSYEEIIKANDFLVELIAKGKNFHNKINKSINLIYYTLWNEEGKKFIIDYAKKIDILSPVWFELKPENLQGEYITVIDGSNYIDKDLISKLKELNKNMLIIPKFQCSNFAVDSLSMMLSESNSEKLIKNLIKRVKISKFDGLSLECTQVWLNDSIYSLYSSFQINLYKALQSINKKLIVTFFPYSESILSNINRVRFDYLNRYLDYAAIMTYDYIQFMRNENPRAYDLKNSPEPWIKQTLDFYIDNKKENKDKLLKKVLIGISFHGYLIDTSDIKGMKGNIVDNKKLTEIMTNTKDSELTLKWNKIDKEYDSVGLKEIPEAKNLKDVLDRLRNLKEKNTSIIESIFREINQENVIRVFLEVLRKNASESNFYKEQIDKYDKMLNQLGELEDAISMTKIDIIKYNDAFVAVKESKLKPKPENESFFRELESYCQLYNEKLTNLHQGLNFYSGLNDKLIDLTNNVTDFIFSRDLEKNDLLKAVSSGGTNIPHNTNSKYINYFILGFNDFMNPQQNNITNFNPNQGQGQQNQGYQGQQNQGYQGQQNQGYQGQQNQGQGYNQHNFTPYQGQGGNNQYSYFK